MGTIVKGDDVGIEIMAEVLAVDSQDFCVRAKDIIDVAYSFAVMLRHFFYPCCDFRSVHLWHQGAVGIVCNHLSKYCFPASQSTFIFVHPGQI